MGSFCLQAAAFAVDHWQRFIISVDVAGQRPAQLATCSGNLAFMPWCALMATVNIMAGGDTVFFNSLVLLMDIGRWDNNGVTRATIVVM